MKWRATPESSLHDSICNDNSGNELGWVSDCADRYEAYFSEPRAAVFLGSYKTPRLAQMAVERQLLRNWFRYEWTISKTVNTLFTNNGTDWLGLYDTCRFTSEMSSRLARAKREFLAEL